MGDLLRFVSRTGPASPDPVEFDDFERWVREWSQESGTFAAETGAVLEHADGVLREMREAREERARARGGRMEEALRKVFAAYLRLQADQIERGER